MHALLKLSFCFLSIYQMDAHSAEISDNQRTAEKAECTAVFYKREFIPNRESISEPGHYCLTQDFVQWRKGDWTSGATGLGNPAENGIIGLGTDHIDLDLAGHLLDAGPYRDVAAIAVWISPTKRQENYHQDLTIRNGRINTPGAGGVGIDISGGSSYCLNLSKVTYDKGTPGLCPMEDDKTARTRTRFFDAPLDPNTRYLIENMHIHAGGRAVSMGGGNNTLRNNTFEVDGHTAIVMYGPHPVIENNTFIVHLDRGIPLPTLPAIIKLRDADGAIIRNNRFIVKSTFPWGRRAEAAINLLESKDVLIENNHAQDVELLVRKDELSTTVERGNVLK